MSKKTIFKTLIYDSETSFQGALLPPLYKICSKIEVKTEPMVHGKGPWALLVQTAAMPVNFTAGVMAASLSTTGGKSFYTTVMAIAGSAGVAFFAVWSSGAQAVMAQGALGYAAAAAVGLGSAAAGALATGAFFFGVGAVIGSVLSLLHMPWALKNSVKAIVKNKKNNRPAMASLPSRPAPPPSPPPIPAATAKHMSLIFSGAPENYTAQEALEVVELLSQKLPEAQRQALAEGLGAKFDLVTRPQYAAARQQLIEADIAAAAQLPVPEPQPPLHLRPKKKG